MFALFHFFFDLFKIAIQAAVYSAILWALVLVLTIIFSVRKPKLSLYRRMYFLMAGTLFAFSFTYYGEHGLGDESQIPLGHWREMNASDGYAYFNLKSGTQIPVDSFLVRSDHLHMASNGVFYDYQLSSGKWTQFSDKKVYEHYGLMHRLPSIKEFKTFWVQYNLYWNGWRFWLLP